MGLCEWGEHWEGAVLSLVWVGGCCGPGAGRWLSRWAPCPSPVPAPPPPSSCHHVSLPPSFSRTMLQ